MRMPFDQKELEVLTKVKSGVIPDFKGVFIKDVSNANDITVTFNITDPYAADLFLSAMYGETIHKKQDGFCAATGLKIKEIGMQNHNAFDAVRALQPIIDSVLEYEEKMNQIMTNFQSK